MTLQWQVKDIDDLAERQSLTQPMHAKMTLLVSTVVE